MITAEQSDQDRADAVRRTLQRVAKQAEGVTLNMVDRERIGDELADIGDLLDDMHDITSP